MNADLALVVVTLLWGLTFPLIRGAVQDIPETHFLMLRFFVGALAHVPFLKGRWRQLLKPKVALWCLLVAVVYWVSYATQTMGLKTVEAGRAGFVTGLCVIFVPLLSPLFGRQWPTPLNLGFALVAVGGMYLLTGANLSGFGVGDAWILACALTYAVHIHLLQIGGEKQTVEPFVFSFALATLMTGISALTALMVPHQPIAWEAVKTSTWLAILYCGVCASLLTTWMQAVYQPRTTPERAAIVYALEPLFAAFCGWLLLDEAMGFVAKIGGGLIVLSVIGNEFLKWPFSSNPPGASPTPPPST